MQSRTLYNWNIDHLASPLNRLEKVVFRIMHHVQHLQLETYSELIYGIVKLIVLLLKSNLTFLVFADIARPL
jgi:hypothetical protein